MFCSSFKFTSYFYLPFGSSEIAQDEILLSVRLNYDGEYQRKCQNRSEKKYRKNKKAKLGSKSDFTINIRFLSTYFRGEVDILAVLCYNRYPRKATKYEQLNDKKRLRLVPSRNPFFIAYSILQKNAISNLLSSRNNLCKQKTRTRNNFPGAYFSSVVEVTGLAPAYRRKTIWLSPCKVYF